MHVLFEGEDVYLTHKHKSVQPSQIHEKAAVLDEHFTAGHAALSKKQQLNLVQLLTRLDMTRAA